MNFCWLFELSSKLIKCCKCCIHWTMSSRSRFYLISFQKCLCLVFVLFDPKFVISFVESFFWRNFARAIIARTRVVMTEPLGILIEVTFLANTNFALFQLLLLRVLFFDWFFKAICTYSRTFSVLLFHLYSIQISIFRQFGVNFVLQRNFFKSIKVPLILSAMYMCWRYTFCHF